MRLVDSYTDAILFARQLVPNLSVEKTAVGGEDGSEDTEDAVEDEFEKVKSKLVSLLQASVDNAMEHNFDEKLAQSALLPVVAYIDEMVLCSDWQYRTRWQKESLQRYFFDTTNIGSLFYESLNELSKQGSDAWVREVYVLCLGLGFKGRYFTNEDRRVLEEIKGFNVALLLPNEAQRNIETATLFPSAYSSTDHERQGGFSARLNVIPYVVAAPIIVLLSIIVYYHINIAEVLERIVKVVN